MNDDDLEMTVVTPPIEEWKTLDTFVREIGQYKYKVIVAENNSNGIFRGVIQSMDDPTFFDRITAKTNFKLTNAVTEAEVRETLDAFLGEIAQNNEPV